MSSSMNDEELRARLEIIEAKILDIYEKLTSLMDQARDLRTEIAGLKAPSADHG